MYNYIRDNLIQFQHPHPKSPQYSPHEYDPIKYGNKTQQYTSQPDTFTLLNKDGIKYVQQVTG